jgi:hypothetical protein
MNTSTGSFDQKRLTPGTTAITVLQGFLAATMTTAALANDYVAADNPNYYEHFIEKPFDGTNSALLQQIPRGETYDRLVSSILSLKTLAEDWDGYGAEQIAQRSIDYALLFANSYKDIAESFEPYPDPDGTVSLESHWGSNVAYLNFSSTGEIAYVLQTASGPHRGRSFDVIAVKKLLDAIYF